MRDAEERAEGAARRKMARSAAVAEKAEEAVAQVEAAPFQAVFSVPGRVSVAPNGDAKRVQLQADSLEPVLTARSTPKIDSKAFLYAKLVAPKGGAPLLPGRVSLFRDGTFTGNGSLPLLPAGEEHDLGFGVDDAIRVKYAVIEEKRGETGYISSSRNDQRNYKITVKNLRERAMQVTIFDQIPASQNQDIKVEATGRTQPSRANVEDKRGINAYDFELKPDEEKVLEFGYRVTWPGSKAVTYGTR